MLFKWENVRVNKDYTEWALVELESGKELARIWLSNQAYPVDNWRIRRRIQKAFCMYSIKDFLSTIGALERS